MSALIVLCSIFCLASCSKEDSSFTFSPSAITISVGQTASVNVIVVNDTGGTVTCNYTADKAGIIECPESLSANTFTFTGVSAGTVTVTGYVVSEPSLKGTLKITVTE